ncbi:YutD family protein [Brevibacillus nitrificans]|uniref:YutD family protein n=1 Tax=Brevibacillus nitrificans TaxID=651560 RepID=UPI002E237D9D|nr:YutD family protein [Brevibacillus nitrificans]
MIRTQAGTYEVMEENRDGWNPEAFKERYSDILDKYDYIVGDWGYGQLRLRGFYTDLNRKVPFEQRIAALDEYLHEFCNFGCPYFVLRKVKSFLGTEDSGASQDDTAYDLIIDIRQDSNREDNGNSIAERKERRRFHPRQNKPEKPERNNGTPRNDRGDKPKFSKDKSDKNSRDQGKDRRPNQMRPNRERDKVPTGLNHRNENPK